MDVNVKDIPDIIGDRTFGIRSFTVRLGQEKVSCLLLFCIIRTRVNYGSRDTSYALLFIQPVFVYRYFGFAFIFYWLLMVLLVLWELILSTFGANLLQYVIAHFQIIRSINSSIYYLYFLICKFMMSITLILRYLPTILFSFVQF